MPKVGRNERKNGGAMKLNAWAVVLTICWIGALPVWAAAPMEELKGPIDQVVRILQDPKYQDKSQSEAQRTELMAVINGIFDFQEISKRTIGRRWKSFDQKQQREFQETFADFLGYTYYQKVRDAYQGEKVVFLSQEVLENGNAVVKTNIPRKQGQIPLDYRMINKKEGWRIYDVIIEGVSLVKNYRTQFNTILGKETPDQLISRLKQKIQEQKQGSSS
ncbi:MAG: ABC transporter substrate-binding protein [Desulfobacteraceae bacterium]|nr:MAG: ABC transporter substrate-binding protein [Desulfobacteraceae bacterium]